MALLAREELNQVGLTGALACLVYVQGNVQRNAAATALGHATQQVREAFPGLFHAALFWCFLLRVIRSINPRQR